MAKRKLTPKQENKDKTDYGALLKEFFGSSATHYIAGLLVFVFALFAAMAMISFFFTGDIDQSQVEGSAPMNETRNWMGTAGAVLSNSLINNWFGVSSFFILVYLAMIGLRLMMVRYFPLIKNFIILALVTIWTSVALSFFFGGFFKESVVFIGGKHGLIVSDLLTKTLGNFGTILLLFVSFVFIMMLITPKTTPFLTNLAENPKRSKWFGWLKKENKGDYPKKEKKKRKEKEDEEDFIPEVTNPTVLVVEEEDKTEPFKEEDGFTIIVPEEEDDNINDRKGDEDIPIDIVRPEDELGDENLKDMEPYDPTLDLPHYKRPVLDLLIKYDTSRNTQVDMNEQNENKNKIIRTLEQFGIRIKSIQATVGPTITLYEIIPDDGVRISKIRNLGDDIAMSLAALGIRIIAPMPGKGTIGIEVPNKDAQIVSMHSVIASKKYQESTMELPIALGKTITNEVFMVDLAKMPHLLVAGATGQGKSVGLNAAITSLLYKKHPAELKFVLVDPKMVEFSIYSIIEKHFLAKLPDGDRPIITDFTKVIHTLNSLCKEMDDRYSLLEKASVRNIKEYNEKFINRRLNPLKGHHFMPYIVVIIDEFGDLIMTAGKEIELPIARIAQKARAVGIHMIIATQRPTTNIITGTIKANFPARVAFRVMTMIDSRTILDSPGANQLVGRGDMLFTQGGDMTRVQCALVDTPEVKRISEYIGEQKGFDTAFPLPEYVAAEGDSSSGNVDLSDKDPMFEEVARFIVIQQQGSTSSIQRKFSIGYNRAGRLMDQLEAAGIVGSVSGSKPREVYVQDEYQLEQLLNGLK